MLSLAIKQLKIRQIHTSTITQQIHNKILFVVTGLNTAIICCAFVESILH